MSVNPAFTDDEKSSAAKSESHSSGISLDETHEEDKPKETVVILGTGDFGRALGGRLAKAGYEVVFGSRDPAKNE